MEENKAVVALHDCLEIKTLLPCLDTPTSEKEMSQQVEEIVQRRKKTLNALSKSTSSMFGTLVSTNVSSKISNDTNCVDDQSYVLCVSLLLPTMTEWCEPVSKDKSWQDFFQQLENAKDMFIASLASTTADTEKLDTIQDYCLHVQTLVRPLFYSSVPKS